MDGLRSRLLPRSRQPPTRVPTDVLPGYAPVAQVAAGAAVDRVVARRAHEDVAAADAVDRVVRADELVDGDQDPRPAVHAVRLVEVAAVAQNGYGRCLEPAGHRELRLVVAGRRNQRLQRIGI